MVVVLCNLKPRNMRGIKSFGMVLAASDAAHEVVEPIMPPAGATIGERIWFGDNKEQVRVEGTRQHVCVAVMNACILALALDEQVNICLGILPSVPLMSMDAVKKWKRVS